MAMNIIIIVFELHVYGTRKNLTYKKIWAHVCRHAMCWPTKQVYLFTTYLT